ncbi:MAG: hypothetical protein KJ826_15520 [Proteobacteria bacterium]|nr:hypothetical protein [Pseudomonadota bacterium]
MFIDTVNPHNREPIPAGSHEKLIFKREAIVKCTSIVVFDRHNYSPIILHVMAVFFG